MRLLDTNTRFFNEKSKGVPPLNNSWGSLLKVLDSCLVEGSEKQPVISISTTEDSEYPQLYWISTIVLNSGHSFEKEYSVVKIEGCLEEAYNTVHRVQESNEFNIKIALDKNIYPEKPKDSFITETIFIKLAPLGFSKIFSEDQIGVYKSSNLDNNSCFLRVDNSCPIGYDPTWIKFARVSMYSDMKSIEDFHPRPGRLKAPYYPEDPLRAESSLGTGATGIYGESKWYHSVNAGSNSIEAQGASHGGPFAFDIIGDDRTFYITINLRGYTEYWQRVGYCFGEYLPIASKTSKDFNFILCSHEFNKPANNSSVFSYDTNPGRAESNSAFGRANNSVGKYFFDSSYDGLIISKHIKGSFFSLLIGSYSGYDTGFSFNQYYTEITFAEVYIRLFYPRATVFGGKMRGYHFINSNISSDSFHLNPKVKDIFNSTLIDGSKVKLGLFNIFHSKSSATDFNAMGNLLVAFKLNNWE